MENTTHSVSYVREMSIPALAESALVADEFIVKHGEKQDMYSVLWVDLARQRRRIALDELVRRGAIESYSFV